MSAKDSMAIIDSLWGQTGGLSCKRTRAQQIQQQEKSVDDDLDLDLLRAQKRFFSQAIASDLSKLSFNHSPKDSAAASRSRNHPCANLLEHESVRRDIGSSSSGSNFSQSGSDVTKVEARLGEHSAEKCARGEGGEAITAANRLLFGSAAARWYSSTCASSRAVVPGVTGKTTGHNRRLQPGSRATGAVWTTGYMEAVSEIPERSNPVDFHSIWGASVGGQRFSDQARPAPAAQTDTTAAVVQLRTATELVEQPKDDWNAGIDLRRKALLRSLAFQNSDVAHSQCPMQSESATTTRARQSSRETDEQSDVWRMSGRSEPRAWRPAAGFDDDGQETAQIGASPARPSIKRALDCSVAVVETFEVECAPSLGTGLSCVGSADGGIVAAFHQDHRRRGIGYKRLSRKEQLDRLRGLEQLDGMSGGTAGNPGESSSAMPQSAPTVVSALAGCGVSAAVESSGVASACSGEARRLQQVEHQLRNLSTRPARSPSVTATRGSSLLKPVSWPVMPPTRLKSSFHAASIHGVSQRAYGPAARAIPGSQLRQAGRPG